MAAAGFKNENENDMKGYRLILIFIMTICCNYGQAQSKKLVRDGNKLYQQKKYKEATSAYQEALKKNPAYTPGLFNLGNSLYQQQQYEASRKAMEAAAKTTSDKKEKAATQHNIGNSYLAEKKWQEAADAYKQALRNNPNDADTKYNLSYALQMLKQQQQNGGGGNDNKDNKDQKDENKKEQDKKDENKKDEQNKEQQDQKDQQDKNDKQENEKPKPQPSKLSEKQAEQLLNALQQEEKKLHDKKAKGEAVPVRVEKDW